MAGKCFDKVWKVCGQVKGLLESVAIPYGRLKSNEKQQSELCKHACSLQKILEKVQENAVDTSDELTMLSLEKAQQSLATCLDKCQEIEKQSSLTKLWIAWRDTKEVEEVKSQLDDSTSNMNTCLLSSIYETLAAVQAGLRQVQNPLVGIHQIDSTVQNGPEKVEKPDVTENKPGVLSVRWKPVTAANYYEIQYNQQPGQLVRVESTECLLDSGQLFFPSKLNYNIRVRGINGHGPGEWSKCTPGEFTILPDKPRKPLAVHVNSPNSITLVLEKPSENNHAKPVTHFVVNYHTNEDTEWTNTIFPVDSKALEGEEKIKVNLNWNFETVRTYYIQIRHRNEDGDSIPYEDCIDTNRIPPGEPVGLSVVYKNTNTIIIEWKEPEKNACIVDYYEVHWGKNEESMKIKSTKRCHAVIGNLESGTRYHFKIRVVSKKFCRSEYIQTSAETKSMKWKVAKLAIVFIVGTVLMYMTAEFIVTLTPIIEMIASFLILSKYTAELEDNPKISLLILVVFVGFKTYSLETIPFTCALLLTALVIMANEKDLKKHLHLYSNEC